MVEVDPFHFQTILDYLIQCSQVEDGATSAPCPRPPLEVTDDQKTTVDQLCLYFDLFSHADVSIQYEKAAINDSSSDDSRDNGDTINDVGLSATANDDICNALKTAYWIR